MKQSSSRKRRYHDDNHYKDDHYKDYHSRFIRQSSSFETSNSSSKSRKIDDNKGHDNYWMKKLVEEEDKDPNR